MSILRPGRRGLGSAIAAIIWRLPNAATSLIGGYILLLGVDSGNHLLFDIPWLFASVCYVLGIGLIYTWFKDVRPKG
jgi:hypothetical protein